jgi:peptidoglycan LD-endopeptidase LytH
MKKRRAATSRVVAAAAGGFLAGAITALVVVWDLPNLTHPAKPPGASDAVRVERAPGPLPTTTPIIEADPVPELRDRQLEIPVLNAVRSELRDSFLEKRASSRSHEAMDIMAPRHTPIVAVEDGTIAKLFESKAGGTTVYQFDPAARYVYYYAHLERYAAGLQEGSYVQRGQVLGYAGTSGNAAKDAPHLHFAIFRLTNKKQWWQGSPVDPYEVLK